MQIRSVPSPAPLSRVLAPNAPLRHAVTAAPLPVEGPSARAGSLRPQATPARQAIEAKPPPPTRYRWAMLLISSLPASLPSCGGAMTWIGFVTDGGSIQRLLDTPASPPGHRSSPRPAVHPTARTTSIDAKSAAFAPSDSLPVYGFDPRVSW